MSPQTVIPDMIQVAELYRYPVKGLSPEPVQSLDLTRDGGVSHDRTYALALGTTRFSPTQPEPLDKGHFLMLRANEALAGLRTRFTPETNLFRIDRAEGEAFEADLSTDAGRAETEAFFTNFAGPAARGAIGLVHAEGHKFTDVSVVSPMMMRALSVVNLETVRDLEVRIGREVHPLRFRANVYIDGLDAGAELDWVDREVQIGAMRFRGALRTRRCAAIDVDPVTAQRDTHLPRAIMHQYGHPDLGVYLEIIEDGTLRRGDAVIPPTA